MIDGYYSAFPYSEPIPEWLKDVREPEFERGLSKLEHFSGLALQGLLSDLSGLRKNGFKDSDIAEFAVLMAVDLLKQLGT